MSNREQWESYTSDAQQTPMPPPAFIRQMGERRTRRQRIGAVATVLALAVLGGSALAATSGMFTQQNPEWAAPTQTAVPTLPPTTSTAPAQTPASGSTRVTPNPPDPDDLRAGTIGPA